MDFKIGKIDSILGFEGFGGGVLGDEIDCMDFVLGILINVVLLVLLVGYDDIFGLFNEEIMYLMINIIGILMRKIWSDMVLFEISGGGMVFSVGSINWYLLLGWDGYENNVVRLMWNVLRRFMEVGK